MHFDAAANGLYQGDGQFTAQVFLEFPQAIQHGRLAIGSRDPEAVVPELKSQPFQQAANALPRRGRKHPRQHGITRIHGHADGHRLAMP